MDWFDMLFGLLAIFAGFGIILHTMPNDIWECIYISIFERDSDKGGDSSD